jgi:transcriptional regulator with XRE-family HTH domain
MKLIQYLGYNNIKTTQQKIADILKVTKSTVNTYENKTKYDWDSIIKIANYYEMSPVKLLLDFHYIKQDDINSNAIEPLDNIQNIKDFSTQILAIEILKRLSHINNELTDAFSNINKN